MSFQLDGSSALVNCVINEAECAYHFSAAIIWNVGVNPQFLLAGIFLDLRQILLRHREGNVNGFDLIDIYQRGHVVGLALVHHETAGPAIDRGINGAVQELYAGILNVGLVGCHCRFHRLRTGPELFVLFLRNNARV